MLRALDKYQIPRPFKNLCQFGEYLMSVYILIKVPWTPEVFNNTRQISNHQIKSLATDSRVKLI